MNMQLAGGQAVVNIAQILLFLDDQLIFYQAFGRTLPFSWCVVFFVGEAW